MNLQTIIIDQPAVKSRLDLFFINYFSEDKKFSRQQWSNFIKKNLILVNDYSIKPGYLLKLNDVILIDWTKIAHLQQKKQWLNKNNVKIQILHQDQFKMILNKPPHLPVYSDVKDVDDLKTWLLHFYPYLSTASENAGIVHRLDINTTGIILVAKTLAAFSHYQTAFANREVEKHYLVWLKGTLSHHKIIVNAPIAHKPCEFRTMIVSEYGKKATTIFYALNYVNDYTLCLVKILTGRTHQIRVHAAYINNPVVNDSYYEVIYKNLPDLILLHSYSLHLPKIVNMHDKEAYSCPISQHFTDFTNKQKIKINYQKVQKIIDHAY